MTFQPAGSNGGASRSISRSPRGFSLYWHASYARRRKSSVRLGRQREARNEYGAVGRRLQWRGGRGVRESKANRAYLALKRAIVAGDLAPLTLIDKNEWSARFEVSRLSITSAVNRLAFEGLVVIELQRGSYPIVKQLGAYIRPLASALRIARARWLSKAAATSGPTLRRQFGRSRSVPGKLVATVWPTRSSNWAWARIDPEPPISAWTAAAIASESGASSLGAERMRPAASRAATRPRFSWRRAAIWSPALANVRRPSESRSAMSAPCHQPASVARSCVATQATDTDG